MTGRAPQELDSDGKAAAELERLFLFICEHVKLRRSEHGEDGRDSSVASCLSGRKPARTFRALRECMHPEQALSPGAGLSSLAGVIAPRSDDVGGNACPGAASRATRQINIDSAKTGVAPGCKNTANRDASAAVKGQHHAYTARQSWHDPNRHGADRVAGGYLCVLRQGQKFPLARNRAAFPWLSPAAG